MQIQTEQVRTFFNSIAGQYPEKYSEKKPRHRWHFNQRLVAATGSIDFSGKRILDIGTGTGALYDFLTAKGFASMSFTGCDIAQQMMEASHIPKENRFVGRCYDIDFKGKSFDYIFMLGVTPYIDEKECDQTLDFIARHLEPDGMAIVSFRNEQCLNSTVSALAQPLLRCLPLRDFVATQSFHTYGYSPKEFGDLLAPRFTIEKSVYIDQTFFPMNHLSPRFSVRLAESIQRTVTNQRVLSLLSSDALVFLRHK